jgi:hypothetical protein
MVKRGYFVAGKDEDYGVAVVATTAREAKKLANGDDSMIDVDFVDIRVRWMRESKVDDLPIGVIEDDMLAVRRGVYTYLTGGVCDVCHTANDVQSYKGQAVCQDCLEKIDVKKEG